MKPVIDYLIDNGFFLSKICNLYQVFVEIYNSLICNKKMIF